MPNRLASNRLLQDYLAKTAMAGRSVYGASPRRPIQEATLIESEDPTVEASSNVSSLLRDPSFSGSLIDKYIDDSYKRKPKAAKAGGLDRIFALLGLDLWTPTLNREIRGWTTDEGKADLKGIAKTNLKVGSGALVGQYLLDGAKRVAGAATGKADWIDTLDGKNMGKDLWQNLHGFAQMGLSDFDTGEKLGADNWENTKKYALDQVPEGYPEYAKTALEKSMDFSTGVLGFASDMVTPAFYLSGAKAAGRARMGAGRKVISTGLKGKSYAAKQSLKAKMVMKKGGKEIPYKGMAEFVEGVGKEKARKAIAQAFKKAGVKAKREQIDVVMNSGSKWGSYLDAFTSANNMSEYKALFGAKKANTLARKAIHAAGGKATKKNITDVLTSSDVLERIALESTKPGLYSGSWVFMNNSKLVQGGKAGDYLGRYISNPAVAGFEDLFKTLRSLPGGVGRNVNVSLNAADSAIKQVFAAFPRALNSSKALEQAMTDMRKFLGAASGQEEATIIRSLYLMSQGGKLPKFFSEQADFIKLLEGVSGATENVTYRDLLKVFRDSGGMPRKEIAAIEAHLDSRTVSQINPFTGKVEEGVSYLDVPLHEEVFSLTELSDFLKIGDKPASIGRGGLLGGSMKPAPTPAPKPVPKPVPKPDAVTDYVTAKYPRAVLGEIPSTKAKTDRVAMVRTKDGTKTLHLDPVQVRRTFEERAWATPGRIGDSARRALPEDQFRTLEEWIDFIVEHERAHVKYPKSQFPHLTRGQYEDYMSEVALGSQKPGFVYRHSGVTIDPLSGARVFDREKALKVGKSGEITSKNPLRLIITGEPKGLKWGEKTTRNLLESEIRAHIEKFKHLRITTQGLDMGVDRLVRNLSKELKFKVSGVKPRKTSQKAAQWANFDMLERNPHQVIIVSNNPAKNARLAHLLGQSDLAGFPTDVLSLSGKRTQIFNDHFEEVAKAFQGEIGGKGASQKLLKGRESFLSWRDEARGKVDDFKKWVDDANLLKEDRATIHELLEAVKDSYTTLDWSNPKSISHILKTVRKTDDMLVKAFSSEFDEVTRNMLRAFRDGIVRPIKNQALQMRRTAGSGNLSVRAATETTGVSGGQGGLGFFGAKYDDSGFARGIGTIVNPNKKSKKLYISQGLVRAYNDLATSAPGKKRSLQVYKLAEGPEEFAEMLYGKGAKQTREAEAIHEFYIDTVKLIDENRAGPGLRRITASEKAFLDKAIDDARKAGDKARANNLVKNYVPEPYTAPDGRVYEYERLGIKMFDNADIIVDKAIKSEILDVLGALPQNKTEASELFSFIKGINNLWKMIVTGGGFRLPAIKTDSFLGHKVTGLTRKLGPERHRKLGEIVQYYNENLSFITISQAFTMRNLINNIQVMPFRAGMTLKESIDGFAEGLQVMEAVHRRLGQDPSLGLMGTFTKWVSKPIAPPRLQKMVDEFLETGLMGRSYVPTEFGGKMAGLADEPLTIYGEMASKIADAADASQAMRFNQNIELGNKAGIFFQMRRKGFSVKDAAAMAEHVLFDYSHGSKIETGIIKPATVFYIWQKKNVELMAWIAANEPKKFLAYGRALHAGTSALSGDITDEEREALPPWTSELANIPFKSSDGQIRTISGLNTNLETAVDWSGLGRPTKDVGRSLLAMVAPTFRVPIEQMLDYSAFKGTPVSEDTSAYQYRSIPSQWIKDNIYGIQDMSYTGADGVERTTLRMDGKRKHLIENILARPIGNISKWSVIAAGDTNRAAGLLDMLSGVKHNTYDRDYLLYKYNKEQYDESMKLLEDMGIVREFKYHSIPQRAESIYPGIFEEIDSFKE